jgi:class 3 adenylate cyclase
VDISESIGGTQPAEHWSRLSETSEKSGNYLGACDAAALGLEQHPQSRELQYRAILNLSRAGANKRAQQLWMHYRLGAIPHSDSRNGALEENIAALGARLDREEAFASDATERAAKLKRAAERYETIYRRTSSTFPGINAAVLYELSGASIRAKEIAALIIKECPRANPRSQNDAYQLAADRAAASLLLDDLNDAQTAIEKAATLSANAISIASTRKQLIQICDHKKIDRAIISPLRNRTVIHYTGHMIASADEPGRFPAHAEARVAAQIERELSRHNAGYGYGSLACGADTLIVEALLARQAEVDVVLPFEAKTFANESVLNGGANWSERFDNCLRQVSVIYATEGEYVGDAEIFSYASRLAMGLAILRAQQLASEPVQLAVWDGRETAGKAGTWADIRTWRSHGLKTITVASEGRFTTNARRSGPYRQERSPLPPRKVRAIMFGDFHGFSRLTDRQMLAFYEIVMGNVAAVLDKYEREIVARNTWGDGIFVVFDAIASAARCALHIQAALAELDLRSHGLPVTLGLRLGLDAGAVFEVRDPILRSLSFTGRHVSRTARLEPSTPPGEVYVTEAFAGLFALLEDRQSTCEYVGTMQAPKNYGRLRTYLLKRRNYTGLQDQDR